MSKFNSINKKQLKHFKNHITTLTQNLSFYYLKRLELINDVENYIEQIKGGHILDPVATLSNIIDLRKHEEAKWLSEDDD